MSMYRNLHKENPQAPYLKKILGLSQKWDINVYRYRDIFLFDKGTKIRLITRIGGGNRPDYDGVIFVLQHHENYIRDYDDDYDCTYAIFEFNVPEKYLEDCKKFFTKEPKSLKELSEEVFEEMQNMSKEQLLKDLRFKEIIEIFEKIKEGEDPSGTIYTI